MFCLTEENLAFVDGFSDHSRGYFKHKLPLAVLLTFYEREGRPLTNKDLVPSDVVIPLSQQLQSPIDACEGFNWEGSTAKRFKQKIRGFLGYRPVKLSDMQGLTDWLVKTISEDGITLSKCRVEANAYLKSKKLEPFKPDVMETRIRSSYHSFEKHFFDSVASTLSCHSKTSLDLLWKNAPEADLSISDPETTITLNDLKQHTKGSRRKNIQFEIAKLQRLRELQLSEEIFNGFSPKIIKKYCQRIYAEHPSHIQAHKDLQRWSTLASFCHVRTQQVTDTLVEQLIQMIHRIRTKSEKAVKEYIFQNVKHVNGKFDILHSLAEASLSSPEGTVQDVIYPKVSAEILSDLITDLNHTGGWYRYHVNAKMHSFYAHHSRAVIFSILKEIEFQADDPEQVPLIKALSMVQKMHGDKGKYFETSDDVPTKGLIPPHWAELVVTKCSKDPAKTLVHRFNYEMALFERLKEKLSHKAIWVKGSYLYRNPQADVPTDFYENKSEYFKNLDLPLDQKVFIEGLKSALTQGLQTLNKELPYNKSVRIIKRKGKNRIKISPALPQAEPKNLMLLQNELQKRWPSVHLLEVIKEADARTNFTQHFQSCSARTSMAQESSRKRLLLCLCALGNNTGLKRISAGNEEENYADLYYIKRRFINAENIRNALVEIINTTLDEREEKIWGTASTGCACDSKQISAWDQNIMTQWHSRYKSAGVMVYWHVDENSLCIYSQLKNCTSSEVASMMEGVLRHSTKMDMNKTYVDTHGKSTIGFAFSHLLQFDLLPRIKGIHRQKLHLPHMDDKGHYPHLEDILSTPIKWNLIQNQYDEIVKYAAALKKGTAETDVLLKRFSKDNYAHPTYMALMELGKAVKTIFLCKYLGNESLRIEINASLNIVERVNGLVDFLFYGKLGEISTNNTSDQEITILSLQLLQVCLVYINTLMIQEILKDPAWKDKLTKEDWRALTPLVHAHINPYGLFPLDMSERLHIETQPRSL